MLVFVIVTIKQVFQHQELQMMDTRNTAASVLFRNSNQLQNSILKKYVMNFLMRLTVWAFRYYVKLACIFIA